MPIHEFLKRPTSESHFLQYAATTSMIAVLCKESAEEYEDMPNAGRGVNDGLEIAIVNVRECAC